MSADDESGMSLNFVVGSGGGTKKKQIRVNQNTKSFKAAKRKKLEEKRRNPQPKAQPNIPAPNHPSRAGGGAAGGFKAPNKGDSVRAAMREGKKPGSAPIKDYRPIDGHAKAVVTDASAKMAAARAAARKEGSIKAQANRAAFVKEAAAVNHVAAATAQAHAEFGGGGGGAAAAAAAAYTGGRGGAASEGGAGAGNTDRSGRKQVISSLFPHKDSSNLPSASDLGVSTNKSSTRSATETVFAVDSMKDLQIEDRLARHMTEQMGIQSLTTVQKMALPSLLKRRDCLIKSATGTGKTLCYAIPMVHDLQRISPMIKRSDGPYAVILLPTRELVLQSFDVLQKLLQPYVWIVPGMVMGGEKKASEKARLRKGINVLVGTPGRMLDHIQNTECLGLGRVRWLILDESDRLLERGFQESLSQIVDGLDGTRKIATTKGYSRCNVLLSATLPSEVQGLALLALKNPKTIDATGSEDLDKKKIKVAAKSQKASAGGGAGGDGVNDGDSDDEEGTKELDQYQTSAKLEQYFAEVPGKLRLVVLVAFLQWKIQNDPVGKAIAFFSSRDTVQFYKQLLGYGNYDDPKAKWGKRKNDKKDSRGRKVKEGADGGGGTGAGSSGSDDEDDDDDDEHLAGFPGFGKDKEKDGEKAPNKPFDDLPLYFLHGGMTQKERTEVFQSFSAATRGVLFCTDVASRGLHLPKVKWIVQCTAPASPAEYVHRVGRTARLDSAGKAILFLLPSELPYLKELEGHGLRMVETTPSTILASLVGEHAAVHAGAALSTKGKEAASALQVGFEQQVVQQMALREMATSAFRSFIRAYATYPLALKQIFHVKLLHLGHIAKSFALRETPTDMGPSSKEGSKAVKHKKHMIKKAEENTMKRARAKKRTVTENEFSSGGANGGMTGPKPKKKKRKKGK